MKNTSPIRLFLLCAIGFGLAGQLSAMDPSKENNYEKQFLKAIQDKDLEQVKKLANNISNINKIIQGNYPLKYAIEMGNLAIVKYLIEEKKANIDPKSYRSSSPLNCAAEKGKLDIVKYLIEEKKADIEETSDFGKKIIHYAAENGNLDIVKYLIEEKDVNIDTKNILGQTPLHYAAKKGKLNIVEYLIEKRADINAKDTSGYTALDLAKNFMKNPDSEVIKYLEKQMPLSENISEQSEEEQQKLQEQQELEYEQVKKEKFPKLFDINSNPAGAFSFIAIWYNYLSDYISNSWKNVTSWIWNPLIKRFAQK